MEALRTLVVGADSDIGFCLLGQLKGQVTAHYFAKPERFESLSVPGLSVTPLFGDLGSIEGIKEFVQSAKALGEYDRIVHLPSAQVKQARFKSFDETAFLKEFNIAFMSASIIFKELLPQMAKRKFGKVVVVLTSYCIGVPPKYIAGYVSSKYALMGLTKALAAEYASKGITVNAVAPSMVETSFVSNMPDFEKEQNAAANPLGRNATPEDIAPAIAFLLSDKTEFINGAVLPVTAGSNF